MILCRHFIKHLVYRKFQFQQHHESGTKKRVLIQNIFSDQTIKFPENSEDNDLWYDREFTWLGFVWFLEDQIDPVRSSTNGK